MHGPVSMGKGSGRPYVDKISGVQNFCRVKLKKEEVSAGISMRSSLSSGSLG